MTRLRQILAGGTALTVVTVLAAAQPAAADRSAGPPPRPGNWPQWRHDPALTGGNPQETVLGPAAVPGLRVRWSVPVPAGGGFGSAPAVAGSRIFVQTGDPQSLRAYSTSGRALWSTAWRRPALDVDVISPAVAGHRVVGQLARLQVGLDAATGTPVWTGTSVGTPVVARGQVYSGDRTRLGSRSLASGDLAWGGPQRHQVRTPAVAGSRVFDSEGTHRRVARDRATGAVLWSVQTGGGQQAGAGPDILVAGDLVVGSCLTDDGGVQLCANRVRSGRFAWRVPVDGVLRPPATAGGIVFTVSSAGTVSAFRLADGRPVWRVPGAAGSAPAVADGVLYVGTADRRLLALDTRDGSVLWSGPTTGRVSPAGPVVADGSVYAQQDDGRLTAWGLG